MEIKPLDELLLLWDFKISLCSLLVVSICVNVTYASWSAPKDELFHKMYVFNPLDTTSN